MNDEANGAGEIESIERIGDGNPIVLPTNLTNLRLQIEEDKDLKTPLDVNDKFVQILDGLDARVERYRREAIQLKEQQEFLQMSIDFMKCYDFVNALDPVKQKEIDGYLERLATRLTTVHLQVHIVRNPSQEECLSQVNSFIDMMIRVNNPNLACGRCRSFLNACCSAVDGCALADEPVDKAFENALLGCTLDDQKTIKKRLNALMTYLEKQVGAH